MVGQLSEALFRMVLSRPVALCLAADALSRRTRCHGEGHVPASRVRLGEPRLLGAAELSRQLESLSGRVCTTLCSRAQQRKNLVLARCFRRGEERSASTGVTSAYLLGRPSYRPRGRTLWRPAALLVDSAGAADGAELGERRRDNAGNRLSRRTCPRGGELLRQQVVARVGGVLNGWPLRSCSVVALKDMEGKSPNVRVLLGGS